jgi:hypothetical protein
MAVDFERVRPGTVGNSLCGAIVTEIDGGDVEGRVGLKAVFFKDELLDEL